jgi:predicted transposase/invertase (TIGR01784 family)
MAYTMKHIYKEEFLPAFKALLKELKTIEKAGEESYIVRTLSYIVEASEIKEEEFIKNVQIELTNTDEVKVMTLAQQWMQQGMEKGYQQGQLDGIEKGKQEGKQEGKVETLYSIAMKLLTQGMTAKQIANLIGLPIQKINSLQFKKQNKKGS